MRSQLWKFISPLLCLFLLTACELKDNRSADDARVENVPTRRELIGERLYRTYCAGCHGETGEGDGLHGFALNPPPANHADSSYMSGLSDEDLVEAIRNGGATVGRSKEMPRWKDTLSKNEIDNLVIYIRTLPNKHRELEAESGDGGAE